jgi:hypothetical protein
MVLELWFVVPSKDTMLGLCADQQVQTDKCGTLTPKMAKNFLVPGPNENLFALSLCHNKQIILGLGVSMLFPRAVGSNHVRNRIIHLVPRPLLPKH